MVVEVFSITIQGIGDLVVYRRGVYELIEGSCGYRVLWGRKRCHRTTCRSYEGLYRLGADIIEL